MADERRDGDDDRAAKNGEVLDRLQVELLLHHRVDPAVAIRRDRVDDSLQQLPAETFAGKNVADLAALYLRDMLDFVNLVISVPLNAFETGQVFFAP